MNCFARSLNNRRFVFSKSKMNRIFDGELIAKAKESIGSIFDSITYAAPAITVGAWIVVAGVSALFLARVYREIK